LAWRDATLAAICDRLEPWAHGTVARARTHPQYFDFNVVRVADDPRMSVEALAAFADEALDGLGHRRVDFDLIGPAELRRAGFAAQGWKSTRLLWLRHEAAPPRLPDAPIEEVAYDAVHDLRVAWHEEDFSDHDFAGYHLQSREVALRRGAKVLAAYEAGLPVAFAQLERAGRAAEITQVYVHPEHRGAGRGAAVTCAAIEAAGDAEDLWICADDEARPKELYARLGFRAAWTTMEFLRVL
jgi:ribosomal protein S18 acetylase RimI-like enzyme